MKREKMRELDVADLDEVTGGVAPLLLVGAGAAVGVGAKWVYDNYLRSRPSSATPEMTRRNCYGYDRPGGNSFDVRVCEK